MAKRLVLLVLFLALLAVAGGAAWVFWDLPSVDHFEERLAAPSLRITDRHGRLLYEVIPTQGGRHTPVPLASIPLDLRQATISTEDAAFYEHPGVDLAGIARALWINLKGGETRAGGSTLTQQVARNLLMEPAERGERSLRRKLRESWLAWRLSRRYSKDEILSFYLNQTYYGALAYGVEAAAQTYFGKSVSDLDLAECALLAGLPQAPGLYNPFTDPEAARRRQAVVLGLMEKHGVISAEQRLLAEAQPLVYAGNPYPIEAPHFVMWVRAGLDDLLPPGALTSGQALAVRTTLDLDWQKHAERIAAAHLDRLNHPPEGGPGHDVHNAALVALNPHTGEILAMLGSPDYFDESISGAVNMALVPAQPGSAIKPIIYAAALDPTRPRPWTAATLILDVRTSFPTHDGKPYVPENYDRQEHGPVLARQALASSLNIPAVVALHEVGLGPAVQLASRLGITTFGDPDEYDLTLALGGGSARLLELAAAYGAFANGGYRVSPFAVLEITNGQGEILYTTAPGGEPPPAGPRVLDERVAWLITDILRDDDARRIGFGANSVLRLDRPAAAKTGTTTNFHDNWTIGYTPDLVVGVWVGNADYQPMQQVTGLTGAGPIWHAFMRTVLAGQPKRDFPRPSGLVQVEVCALSGLLPTLDCPYRRKEWFIQGTEPHSPDHLVRKITLDALTGLPAADEIPAERRVSRLFLDLPPRAHAWARSQGLPLLADVCRLSCQSPAVPPACSASCPLAPAQVDTPAPSQAGNDGDSAPQGDPGSVATGGSLRLLSPDPNAIFRISDSHPLEMQSLRLAAAGPGGVSLVRIFLDGSLLAELDEAPYETWWILQPGEHQAWAEAVLANGSIIASEKIFFTVKEN